MTTAGSTPALPPPGVLPSSLTFIERDWLSSNHLVGFNRRQSESAAQAVVVDTGYGSRSDLTVALIARTLSGRPLARIINTHAHSDHVGGNAALQALYQCPIQVPEDAYAGLLRWEPDPLPYEAMGQACPQFVPTEVYGPGDRLLIGDLEWQVFAAPGHDTDAVMLYQPQHGLLVSGDALWENGFGVLFPAFFDAPAFDQQQATLDQIAALDVTLVLPGHGRLFGDTAASLARAHKRLASWREQPERHARHALKVLLAFQLLDQGQIALEGLTATFGRLALTERINARYFGRSAQQLTSEIRDELISAGVARIEGTLLRSASTSSA